MVIDIELFIIDTIPEFNEYFNSVIETLKYLDERERREYLFKLNGPLINTIMSIGAFAEIFNNEFGYDFDEVKN